MRTRTRLINQFEDHKDMIWKLARKKSQIYGIEAEELFGRGSILFVEAVSQYNKERGTKFSTFLYMYLDSKMVIWERGFGKTYRPQSGMEQAILSVPAGTNPARIVEFKDQIEKLPGECREILRIIFQAPHEILEDGSPKRAIGNLKSKLRRSGFTSWGILKAFREIRAILV